uniref:Pseudouridine synthase RsuA/RluA-like domain-containing protein n=1 Tax=Parascaris equorum TaxID=6256 RepID=A0A914RP18_PAREQ
MISNGEEVICEEPIGALVLTMGIQCVRSDGKSARTRFRCLWSDGKTSVVKCVLDTGRTHQIRVHLQYLGMYLGIFVHFMGISLRVSEKSLLEYPGYLS